jgi:putative DNA-invertase from lambdoid prophage Rac
MRAAIYARVSTYDQHCQMQVRELKEDATRRGWGQVEYVDMESTRKRRPELERLLADAAKGKLDTVLVWKLDRFGRSVQELVANIAALDRAGVRFIVASQGIDTDKRNPTSRFLLHILAAVAEFERDLIQERVKAGQAEYMRAYEAGEVGPGKSRESKSKRNLAAHRPRKVFARAEAVKLRKSGLSWGAISARLGVSVSTVRDSVNSRDRTTKKGNYIFNFRNPLDIIK